MNLILGMIVRNEAEMLHLTLPITKSLPLHKIALDFRSTDSTRIILAAHGWLVMDGGPWPNNYSTARNALLDHGRASCPDGWMLQLDADECMWPEDMERVTRFTTIHREPVLALPRVNHVRGGLYESASWPDHQSRCIRLESDVRYKLPVHEVVNTNDVHPAAWVGGFKGAIHHYGWCKSPRANWLRSHNYTLLAEGKEPLQEPPPWVHNNYDLWLTDMRQRHTFTPFEGSHPLKDHQWT